MKTSLFTVIFLLGFLLSKPAYSQQFSMGIELGAQTAVPHYFSWGQYGEEEVDLLRPYLQSNINSYTGGFLEKKLNGVLSVRTGVLLNHISFSRSNPTGQPPNALNSIQVNNTFYHKTTMHRLGIPLSLRVALSSRMTIGAGIHVSKTFLTTARGWVGANVAGNTPLRVQFAPRFVFVPDFHLASFMTASYKLMDFYSKPLFLTVTGEYDHRWSMPVFNGINYRVIRLGLGVELRFK